MRHIASALLCLFLAAPLDLSAERIYLEPEKGTITSPLEVSSHNDASNEEYVSVASGNNSLSTAAATGTIQVDFTVAEGGEYTIWGRTIAPNSNDDSFYVRINEGPWIVWNSIPNSSSWQWNTVHNISEGTTPIAETLSAGTHRIEIAYREDGALIDKLLITNEPSFIPEGIGASAQNLTSTPIPNTSEYVYLEAENGDLSAPFERQSDNGASNDAYLEVASGNNSSSSPPRFGTSRISFTLLSDGRYRIWGRVITPTTSDDSFYIRINSGPWNEWNSIPRSTTWKWNTVHHTANGSEPTEYTLPAGDHIIEIAYREDGSKIDKLLLTNDSDFIPNEAGGIAQNLSTATLPEEDFRGYRMWLQYDALEETVRSSYETRINSILNLEVDDIAINAADELKRGTEGLLAKTIGTSGTVAANGQIILGTFNNPWIKSQFSVEDMAAVSTEGYLLSERTAGESRYFIVAAQTSSGLLYGVFDFLRQLQTGTFLVNSDVPQNPTFSERILNHWDNVFHGSIERGYAGGTIFKWDRLEELTERHQDYARYAASIGINGIVINNVNTSTVDGSTWKLLMSENLDELATMAARLRVWGIRLYLSVNFASPELIGGLSTADPYDSEVIAWWENKTDEIYAAIPDFGGYLVKADSEGEPGPQSYGRNHVDGANLLASALAPHGGRVFWRAFVYDFGTAYELFQPFDGQFLDNATVQIKYGPTDFQIREPVHALFGAMPQTDQILELQITQEYTGQQIHLVYWAPYWKEILEFNTYGGPGNGLVKDLMAQGEGFGVVGVSNFGDDVTWTGHHLAAANSYAFGRLAWDPDLTAEGIAGEWARMTFGIQPQAEQTIGEMLMDSHRIFESYTSPLGIGLISGGNHYDPEEERLERLFKAGGNSVGLGLSFADYSEPNRSTFGNLSTCPDELLLYFHNVPYSHILQSGKSVIDHIYHSHLDGPFEVRKLQREWDSLSEFIDPVRHKAVAFRLQLQYEHSEVWRDAINNYIAGKSGIQPETNVDGDILDDRWERTMLGTTDKSPGEPIENAPGLSYLYLRAFELAVGEALTPFSSMQVADQGFSVEFERPSELGQTYAIQRYDQHSEIWVDVATHSPEDSEWKLLETITVSEVERFDVKTVSISAPIDYYGTTLLLRVSLR